MANFRSGAIVLTLGQPIGTIATANPTISQHPWVPAATTTASLYNDDGRARAALGSPVGAFYAKSHRREGIEQQHRDAGVEPT